MCFTLEGVHSYETYIHQRTVGEAREVEARREVCKGYFYNHLVIINPQPIDPIPNLAYCSYNLAMDRLWVEIQ